jgi:hypothetical protein
MVIISTKNCIIHTKCLDNSINNYVKKNDKIFTQKSITGNVC